MSKPLATARADGFVGPDAPDEAGLYRCVHCGFCLQVCPTYVETGLEAESPRGRIALMKAVNEGRIGITQGVIRHWDLCIQCRACEVACPSGVPYGSLIEATLAQSARKRKMNPVLRLVSAVLVKRVLPYRRRLAALVGALRLYQRTGIQAAVRRTGLLRLVSARLSELEQSLPAIPSTSFSASGQVIPAQGERTAGVALLSGCVMPLVNGPQMDAVARVLARNGCEVVVPKGQVCCGAISTHVGDLETGRRLARRNIDVFLESGADVIVAASAGCGSRMKEYYGLLKNDAVYAPKARRMAEHVKDIHELLVELPFAPPRAALDYKVTYQDSCHLSNGQRITQQPRELLRSIPGIRYVELPNADMCCGNEGTYTITERELSLRVLESKMKAVKETGADIVATASPGCLLQLQYGALKDGSPVQVRYVTDLLDEAYRLEGRR